jgi:predicted metal-dependent HD superfamily phosphohydrolase
VATLLDDWSALVGGVHLDVGRQLLARWNESHRHYHTADHLTAVLDHVAELEGKGCVLLAAWYHDAIYWPARHDNEERSARLAQRTLSGIGINQPTVAEVVRLIRLTVTHDPAPDDGNGAILCDADLAILGARPDAYRRYAAAIRAEYAHLDPPTFAAGRTAVLRRLLGRPRLFRTTKGSRRWEQSARVNIKTELAGMGRGEGQPAEA